VTFCAACHAIGDRVHASVAKLPVAVETALCNTWTYVTRCAERTFGACAAGAIRRGDDHPADPDHTCPQELISSHLTDVVAES
jgi:hypothetical protein